VHKTKKGTQPDAKRTKAANNSVLPKQKNSKKSKKQYYHIVFEDWCKGCGICSALCPKKVIGQGKNGKPVIERPDECIGCRFCEQHCPDFAITVKERNAEPEGNLW
jgi:2-oxoglutarate ferredoxin oxidoreductase subunit delta